MTRPPTHDDIYGDECRRLKAEGLRQSEIAKRLGISDSSVRYILADAELREHILAGKREGKARRQYYGAPHNPLPQPRVEKRIPPVPVSREVINAACLEFAKRRISRAELMRRITPQAVV